MKSGGWFIELDFVLMKSETRSSLSIKLLKCKLFPKSELIWAGYGAGCRENLQHRPEDTPGPGLPGAMKM